MGMYSLYINVCMYAYRRRRTLELTQRVVTHRNNTVFYSMCTYTLYIYVCMYVILYGYVHSLYIYMHTAAAAPSTSLVLASALRRASTSAARRSSACACWAAASCARAYGCE